jgi:predicted ferric reductase
MKTVVLLFILFSVPVLTFAESKNPGNFSYFKILGALSGNLILIVMAAALLRFGAKRYLKALHSREHSFSKEIAQKLIRYHKHFAMSALLLIIIHGIVMSIPRNFWNTQMLLGVVSLLLFALTSYFGILITKRRVQRQLFYQLHMTTLVLALSTVLIHIQYKPFLRLFL